MLILFALSKQKIFKFIYHSIGNTIGIIFAFGSTFLKPCPQEIRLCTTNGNLYHYFVICSSVRVEIKLI